MDVNKGLESGREQRVWDDDRQELPRRNRLELAHGFWQNCLQRGQSGRSPWGPTFMGLSSGSVVLSAATSASADFVIEALNCSHQWMDYWHPQIADLKAILPLAFSAGLKMRHKMYALLTTLSHYM